jgi:hypothetical protein
MPRLSLYRPEKTRDYKFFDRNIREQLYIGGTDLYVHKYLGVQDNQTTTVDQTQPHYDSLDPTKIQDLLFLENRDRKYAPDIYRLRGHYSVQNLDFDLSQFGLFLNNDIIFIVVHYNEMIELIGRKLMVGDVLELPHLTDYHPLNETIPIGLRRYYQVTDGNFASEGFTPTWYPHLWRVKCEPLVDSQEFSNILDKPINKDTYLGDWSDTTSYPPGYTVTYGDKTYIAIDTVPAGTPCTDTNYWELDTASNLKDLISRYNKNIEINDAAIAEAARLVPKSGYDRSQLYVVPTDQNDEPASPVNIVHKKGIPVGTFQMFSSPGYKRAAPVVRVTQEALKSIWDMTADSDPSAFGSSKKVNIKMTRMKPDRTDSGSGPVKGKMALSLSMSGSVDGPYGTSDNTFSAADQDPTQEGFTGTIIQDVMDYRADADPRFNFIARSSPRSFGYTDGYLVGTAEAPNGLPTGAGITFPASPRLGDYFLRTDYLPQQLFRWDGNLWIKISENVRTGVALGDDDQSQKATFINNSNVTVLTDGTTTPERQALSTILKIQPD